MYRAGRTDYSLLRDRAGRAHKTDRLRSRPLTNENPPLSFVSVSLRRNVLKSFDRNNTPISFIGQSKRQANVAKMASLKRSAGENPLVSNTSSKVYVRSTKSGKVQKIVREVYLRQDIPCSSNLCSSCLKTAPRDAAGKGITSYPYLGLLNPAQLHRSTS